MWQCIKKAKYLNLYYWVIYQQCVIGDAPDYVEIILESVEDPTDEVYCCGTGQL